MSEELENAETQTVAKTRKRATKSTEATKDAKEAKEAAPKKRATRAAKAEKAQVEASADAVTSTAALVEEPKTSTRATRATRTTRAKKAAADAAADAAEATVASAAAEATEAAPEAPAPKRRGRKKAVPAEGEAAEVAQATQAVAPAASPASVSASAEAVEASQAEEAPAPKRRGRKKVVVSAESEEPAAADSKAAAGANAEAGASAGTGEIADVLPMFAEFAQEAATAQGLTSASASDASEAPAPTGRIKRERTDRTERGDHADHADRADHTDNAERGERPKKRMKQSVSFQGDKSYNQNQQNGQQNQNKGGKVTFDRDHRRQRNRPHGSREVLPSISRDELAEMKVGDLREKAAEYSIDASGYRKAELVDVVFEALCKAEGIIEVTGILDIMNDGYGFLRAKGYLPSESDAYVSLSIIRRNGLRKGDYLVGLTRPAQGNEKYAAIQKVISVNDIPADELGGRTRFADLTPIYPDERLIMEHGKNTTTARVIDLVSPIGKGQRGLIVSPPKAGKTTVLKDIAAAISANNPEVHLMCLLVDERPEEVTDMERSIKGEVISSTFDKPCENHIAVAELVIERAKRLVEQGRDVVILLDSITRLARAYNMGTPASGRILSGGVDSSALYPPKRFLGAARNIENGGSLTILGTALVDTGSKMDEVIFEEFKGTGNMELKLDRSLADKRIFPAIDPITSGTRKEELLLDPQEAPLIWAVRRVLANLNNTERAMDTLVKSIKQTETNQEFLIRFARKAQTSSKQDSLDL